MTKKSDMSTRWQKTLTCQHNQKYATLRIVQFQDNPFKHEFESFCFIRGQFFFKTNNAGFCCFVAEEPISPGSNNIPPQKDWSVVAVAAAYLLFAHLLLVNLVIAMFRYGIDFNVVCFVKIDWHEVKINIDNNNILVSLLT